MRQPWFLASCRRRMLRLSFVATLACAGWGCHQHYYYYDNPCAPASPVPSMVRSGPVCEVPTQVVEGETKVADGSSRSTIVSGGRAVAPRVVVSEPAEQAHGSWRRSDPDGSMATTSIQGNVDGASVNR